MEKKLLIQRPTINNEKVRLRITLEVSAVATGFGILCALFKVDTNIISDHLKQVFSKKGDEIAAKNIEAMLKGYGAGKVLLDSGKISIDMKPDEKVKGEILLSGAEAVGFGAVAGGCDFISAYPMTPSTGVFTFLAGQSHDFGIVAEQAEDEIAAINMSLGAWYAGARAMVATAAGGFALMVEGLSLSGMLETPTVIVVGQRPAPATGLPTRTEQGDLNFAVYSGHGEFPRIVFAPGTLEDTFYVTQKAFDLADRYQVPVIILVDQLLMDSYNNIPALNIEDLEIKKYIIETAKDYKRYALTQDGISPRGIPGFGSGLVAVDSDEHDEEGHITEDLEVRTKMVDKRLKKLDAIKTEALPAELIGSKDYETLIVA
ncbi:MAG: 2-oxoacid:acceptor oxidoreductase subunit alpha, partial [Candidatus Margulisiibacteriota bacterium]